MDYPSPFSISTSMLSITVGILFFCSLCTSSSATFDNQIHGEPEVQCGQGLITVRVQTAHGRPSFIFAKGHFHRPGCFFNNTANATFSFDDCNINRKREINPKGMAYSLMVIVQLHPLFITKVDRAYNVRCFYMEADKSIGVELGVSELTTVMLSEGHTVPQCAYTIHRDSQNGPIVRYASVGDQIFHVWDCPSDVYAMMIHDCFILDGQGTEYQVIDAHGCPTDEYLMPELTYSTDLTRTFTEVRVFNFPDRTSVYFNCQIKLCSKKSDDCIGLSVSFSMVFNRFFQPPQCPKRHENILEAELTKEHLLMTTMTTTPSSTRATSNAVRFRSSTASMIPLPTPETIGSFVKVPLSTPETKENSLIPLPTPETIENFVEKGRLVLKVLADPRQGPALLERVDGDGDEGSGEEPMADLLGMNTTEKNNNNETNKLQVFDRKVMRLMRRMHRRSVQLPIATRDNNILDVDVTSPELTILDNTFEMAQREQQNRPDFQSEISQKTNSSPIHVCVPMAWLWLTVGFTFLCLVAALVALFHFRFASLLSKAQSKHVQF